MWKIQDNDGVIHSGTQEEMELAFRIMTDSSIGEEHEREKWEWDESLEN